MNNIYIYQTSPNQKIITTKKTKSDEEHTYGICNIEATLTAAKELTDRAFKLYIRMSLHQDGYTYALSPTEIYNNIEMSDKRYREAVNELIKKGYLMQSKERKNLYIFYESPHVDRELTLPKQTRHNDITERTFNPNKVGCQSVREREILHDSTSQLQLNNTEYNNCNNDKKDLISPEKRYSEMFPDLSDEELPF